MIPLNRIVSAIGPVDPKTMTAECRATIVLTTSMKIDAMDVSHPIARQEANHRVKMNLANAVYGDIRGFLRRVERMADYTEKIAEATFDGTSEEKAIDALRELGEIARDIKVKIEEGMP